MSAPLQNFSGAPVAQIVCATGEICLKVKPAAHWRATAALPVAQQQQAGFSHHGRFRSTGAMPQCRKMEGNNMNIGSYVVFTRSGEFIGAFLHRKHIQRWMDKNAKPGVEYAIGKIGMVQIMGEAENA